MMTGSSFLSRQKCWATPGLETATLYERVAGTFLPSHRVFSSKKFTLGDYYKQYFSKNSIARLILF